MQTTAHFCPAAQLPPETDGNAGEVTGKVTRDAKDLALNCSLGKPALASMVFLLEAMRDLPGWQGNVASTHYVPEDSS